VKYTCWEVKAKVRIVFIFPPLMLRRIIYQLKAE